MSERTPRSGPDRATGFGRESVDRPVGDPGQRERSGEGTVVDGRFDRRAGGRTPSAVSPLGISPTTAVVVVLVVLAFLLLFFVAAVAVAVLL